MDLYTDQISIIVIPCNILAIKPLYSFLFIALSLYILLSILSCFRFNLSSVTIFYICLISLKCINWNFQSKNIDTCFLYYSGNHFFLCFLHDQSLVCLLTYMQEMSYVIHFCVLHQMLWTSFEINNHVSFKVTKPLERFIKLFAVVWKHFIIHQPSCPLRKINVTKVHLLDAIFLLIFTFLFFKVFFYLKDSSLITI